MRRFRIETIVAVIGLLVYLGVAWFQSASTLTKPEVDAYCKILEEKLAKEFEAKDEFISRMRAWGESDDGKPFYNLNVMRFNKTIRAYPGGPTSGTPEEANRHYEDVATGLLLAGGNYPIYAGSVNRMRPGRPESNQMVYGEGLDNWDRVLVVRYAGRRAFFDLLTHPDYLAVMPYKIASLEVLLVPCNAELLIPDLRLLVGGGMLVLFLLTAWICAVRRSRAS